MVVGDGMVMKVRSAVKLGHGDRHCIISTLSLYFTPSACPSLGLAYLLASTRNNITVLRSDLPASKSSAVLRLVQMLVSNETHETMRQHGVCVGR